LRGDPYERTDAVFGVKESLLVDLGKVGDVEGLAEKHGVSPDTKLMTYDFVLVSDKEASDLRHKLAVEALEKSGISGVTVVNGMLVPDVD
jgi:hypothetical protein